MGSRSSSSRARAWSGFREQLTRAAAIARLFERFDAQLRTAGYLAMGGQIVDATVVESTGA
jgi:hypothetical protein